MTTRKKVIDTLWAMGDWRSTENAGDIYDALDAAGLLVPDEETPQPPTKLSGFAGITLLADGRLELRNDAGELVTSTGKPVFPADSAASTIPSKLIDERSIVGTFYGGGIIPAPGPPKYAITEPMPPSLIESIESTAWLADHDAAIREGIAAAIEAASRYNTPGGYKKAAMEHAADLARNWKPAEGEAS